MLYAGQGKGKFLKFCRRPSEAGYKGFLTLEPHLVLFDSLKDLELEDATEVIKDNKGLDGEGGYKLQYESLLQILKNIESKENA